MAQTGSLNCKSLQFPLGMLLGLLRILFLDSDGR